MLTFPFIAMVTAGTEDADKEDLKFQIQNQVPKLKWQYLETTVHLL